MWALFTRTDIYLLTWLSIFLYTSSSHHSKNLPSFQEPAFVLYFSLCTRYKRSTCFCFQIKSTPNSFKDHLSHTICHQPPYSDIPTSPTELCSSPMHGVLQTNLSQIFHTKVAFPFRYFRLLFLCLRFDNQTGCPFPLFGQAISQTVDRRSQFCYRFSSNFFFPFMASSVTCVSFVHSFGAKRLAASCNAASAFFLSTPFCLTED